MFNKVYGTILVLISAAITLAMHLTQHQTSSPLIAAIAVAGVIVYIQGLPE
jgi:hypothetical protein